MAKHSKERTQAEAQFKRTQKAQRATESEQAMADYVAAGHAVRAKTARLKELREVRRYFDFVPCLVLPFLSAASLANRSSFNRAVFARTA